VSAAKPPKATKQQKQRFWSMALWLDMERQKGGKLAKGLYKGRFGDWPKGLIDQPAYPDQAFWNYERASRIAYAKRMESESKRKIPPFNLEEELAKPRPASTAPAPHRRNHTLSASGVSDADLA
jgi:hypothetical protein